RNDRSHSNFHDYQAHDCAPDQHVAPAVPAMPAARAPSSSPRPRSTKGIRLARGGDQGEVDAVGVVRRARRTPPAVSTNPAKPTRGSATDQGPAHHVGIYSTSRGAPFRIFRLAADPSHKQIQVAAHDEVGRQTVMERRTDAFYKELIESL